MTTTYYLVVRIEDEAGGGEMKALMRAIRDADTSQEPEVVAMPDELAGRAKALMEAV